MTELEFCTTVEIPCRYALLEQLAQAADDEAKTELVDVEVTVTYAPGAYVPAFFGGHPDNWHPDESESPEILSVTTASGEDLICLLDDKQLRELERQASRDQDKQARDFCDYDTDYNNWY